MLLGAQDCYFEKNGAFTGEISVEMLKDLGVKFCLTGHSERRHVLNEADRADVAKKAAAVYGGGLMLIHCVGEKLERARRRPDACVVRGAARGAESGEDRRPRPAGDRVRAGLGDRHRPECDRRAGPGGSRVHPPVAGRATWNQDFADRVRIQYGGSMKPENAAGLLSPARRGRRTDRRGGAEGGQLPGDRERGEVTCAECECS